MIFTEDLHFIYPDGTHALRGIDLEIKRGEAVAIMGQNGSGKTTLLQHFIGLLTPTNGHVLINGKDTKDTTVADLAQFVGYVFQNPDHQFIMGVVEEELHYATKTLNLSSSELNHRINSVLELLELEDLKKRRVITLSRGEQQRVAIASVLIRQPSLLLIDQPFLGQDGRQRLLFSRVLLSLNAEGVTLVLNTHEEDFVCENLHRLILLSGGTKLADDNPEVLLSREEVLKKTNLVVPQRIVIHKALISKGLNPQEEFLQLYTYR